MMKTLTLGPGTAAPSQIFTVDIHCRYSQNLPTRLIDRCSLKCSRDLSEPAYSSQDGKIHSYPEWIVVISKIMPV